MTKSDLKELMLVETRDKNRYILLNGWLRNENKMISFDYYDKNLEFKNNGALDIVKVYGISEFLTCNPIDRNLLWQRKADEELNEKDVLQKAIDTYGTIPQMDMAIEEMSELTQAISKYKRAPKNQSINPKIILNIYEEIADVEIMLEQLKIIFACDKEVTDWKQKKIARLNRRLNSE